jgi:hypothetical protein
MAVHAFSPPRYGHNTIISLEPVASFDVWWPTKESKAAKQVHQVLHDPHLSHATFQRRLPFLSHSSCQRHRGLAYANTDQNERTLEIESPLGAPQYDSLDSVSFEEERNRRATQLLLGCQAVGTQVGMDTTEANREFLRDLAKDMIPFTDEKPASVPLEGVYDLIYSDAESGFPAGKVGPFVGKVTQIFHNETVYENVIEVGSVRASVFANRKVLNDTNIEVSFYKRHVEMFGLPVADAVFDSTGSWGQLFVGVANIDGKDDKKRRRVMLRVMQTPNLFILTQDIPDTN